MTFSEFLTWQLERNGMSLDELAKTLTRHGYPVSKGTVGHWKTERNKPPMDLPAFRLALSRSFHMDVNELVRHLGYVIEESDRSIEARMAADLIDAMPTEKRSKALELLERIADW
jgi:hypothetical protein